MCESAEERCILVLYEIKKGAEEGEGERGGKETKMQILIRKCISSCEIRSKL